MPQVKICGNTRAEDAKLAINLGVDYLGFIFAPSKRKVSVEQAQNIISTLGSFKNIVGVFYNQPKDEVLDILNATKIRIAQFHGDETSRYCESFEDKGISVIKSFHIKDAMSLKRIDEYNVQAFLFDTYSKDAAGGTGKTFDWNLIKDKPFITDKLFLAGGLNPDNLKAAIEFVDPFAVDVASGVESEPGIKNSEKLESFIKIAKSFDQNNAKESPIRS